MKQIDFLLPFALPPAEFIQDLLKAINAPALAMLLSRGKLMANRSFDDFSRALPHEYWLAERFGLGRGLQADTSPPVAAALMHALGLNTLAGHWFVLHPVHIHIARDHLVLTDMKQLALSDTESRQLFEEAQTLIRESGLEARYGDVHTWFLRADDWSDLQTATPDAASGHNIDIWMPKGEGERAWRKLQNEIQMHWHTHAVNAVRETTGSRSVNSLWLWGGASTNSTTPSAPYSHAFNLPRWAATLARLCADSAVDVDVDHAISSAPATTLTSTESLVEPAFAEDWGTWLAQLNMLEIDWFAPLLTALKAGKIDHLRLILSHNTGLKEFSIDRSALRKFWIGASLNRLAQ